MKLNSQLKAQARNNPHKIDNDKDKNRGKSNL